MSLKEKCKNIYNSLEGPITFIVIQSVFYMVEVYFPFTSSIISSYDLSYIFTFLFLLIYFMPKYKKEKQGRIKKGNISHKTFYFVLGFLSCIVFNISLYYIFVILLGTVGATTVDGISRTLMFYIITCILGPCIEELCFRAIPKVRLEKKFSNNFLIIFSSIIFGLVHSSSILNIIYAFIIGIFVMNIYIKTNNLLFPILFHVGANFCSSMLDFLPTPDVSTAIYYVPVIIVSTLLEIYIIKNKEKLILKKSK